MTLRLPQRPRASMYCITYFNPTWRPSEYIFFIHPFFCFFNRYATTGQWTPEAFRYFSSQVFGDNWKGRKFLFIFILLNKFWLIFFKLFTELARLFVCTRLDYLFFNMLPIKKTWTELTPGTTLLPSFAKLMARKKIIIANVFTFLLGTKLLLILPTQKGVVRWPKRLGWSI